VTTEPIKRAHITGALAAVLVMMPACGTDTAATNEISGWANSVCQTTASLDGSLRNLRSDLTANLANAQTTVDQAKNQLRQRLDAVTADAQSLHNTVSAAPQSASDAVRQAQQQLQTDETRTAQAVKELQQAATGVEAAGNGAELATQATIAEASLTAATHDVGQFLRSVQQLPSSSAAEIRKAFSQAPSCAQLRTRPTPTG